jgi:anti-sigma factor (TIGR02949 family)
VTLLLTCKQFLQELTEYLDDTIDPAERAELTRHINECPNCWVVCDTTQKTLKVFKGMEAKAVPADIEQRLMSALEKRIAERGPLFKKPKADETGSAPPSKHQV